MTGKEILKAHMINMLWGHIKIANRIATEYDASFVGFITFSEREKIRRLYEEVYALKEGGELTDDHEKRFEEIDRMVNEKIEKIANNRAKDISAEDADLFAEVCILIKECASLIQVCNPAIDEESTLEDYAKRIIGKCALTNARKILLGWDNKLIAAVAKYDEAEKADEEKNEDS